MILEAEWVEEIDGMVVMVDKIGGGTVGKEYVGTWWVSVKTPDPMVRNGHELKFTGDPMVTGSPKTHFQVAKMAAEFVQNYL